MPATAQTGHVSVSMWQASARACVWSASSTTCSKPTLITVLYVTGCFLGFSVVRGGVSRVSEQKFVLVDVYLGNTCITDVPMNGRSRCAGF